MKKQKIMIIIISIIILIALITGIYFIFGRKTGSVNNDRNNIVHNNSQEVDDSEEMDEETKIKNIKGVKTVNGIEISNITITLVEDRKCELTADVKNTTEEYKEATNIRIKTLNKKGNVEEIFGGGITALAPNEPNKMKAIVLANITNAADIQIEVIE